MQALQEIWRFLMKNVLIIVSMLAFSMAANAQTQSLGSTMDVFVFPAEGQDSSQQSKDEAACYEWAVGNTGSDPFQLAWRSRKKPISSKQKPNNKRRSRQEPDPEHGVLSAARQPVR
jgi:hypothetical protein